MKKEKEKELNTRVFPIKFADEMAAELVEDLMMDLMDPEGPQERRAA